LADSGARTLCEEIGIPLDELAGHGGGGQLCQSLSAVALVGADSHLLDLGDSDLRRSPQALDDDLRADPLFHVLLDLLENLAGQDNHRGGSIPHLGVLGTGNIDEDAGSGVNNVEQLCLRVRTTCSKPKDRGDRRSHLHDGRAVVGNGLLAILVHHQQVSTVGTECRFDGRLNRQTHINIRDDLTLSLRGIGP
jgi:hypothetical protein